MNLQNILYATIFIITRLVRTYAENPELVISQSGVDGVTPCGIGLKFFIELNNTSDDHDYEVQVSADQCCLEADGSLDCDVLEIIGDCVGFIPKGAIKTVRMVAPILDPYERRGYCILYLDSKCNYDGRNMRDTVKINFDTKIENINKVLEANIKPCKNVDEDPLNDCKPVDCDSYYNTKRPYYSKKLKRCVAAPPCLSEILSDLPNSFYDPISNRCIKERSINKRDIDFIRRLKLKDRQAKDVLIINKFDDNSADNFSSRVLNDALDKVPMCKKCNKLHILNPTLHSVSHVPRKCYTNFLMTYMKSNKYTILVFGGVILLQCCLIIGMIYYFTRSCACKEKKVIRKFFNYRQDASVTTPLIGTSNIYTETDYNYESDSSNADKKIKCYKACQKEGNKKVKMSLSDDILSKCLNRRNWSRQQYTDAIPETTNETQVNIDDIEINNLQPENEPKKSDESKVVFEDEKPKTGDEISKRIGSIPKCLNKEIIDREKEDIQEYESSEREIQCHSYHNEINSNVTGFRPDSTTKNLGYLKTEKDVLQTYSIATEKGAQASFPNDSIDDLLSERGIYLDENVSKFVFSNDSNLLKSSTLISSKTSKNLIRNLLTFMQKKSKTNISDPGGKQTDNSDLKLIHMSQASIYSTSNDSRCIRYAQHKDSRTSM